MPRAVGQPAHVSFRGMPTPMVRDSLRALARSGRPVTWSAAELDTIAVSAERQREPGAPVRITVAATGLTELRDALGVLDTLRGSGVLEGVEPYGEVRAVHGRVRISASAGTRPELRPVLVVGHASWEAKFVMAALEEQGWTVHARLTVAPGAVVGQGPDYPLDTAHYSAVVATDSVLGTIGARVVTYVRSGGGLVLVGGAGRAPEVRAIAPARALVRRDAAPGGGTHGLALEGLRLLALEGLRNDAVRLAVRGPLIAVAARREGNGRVLQSGYDETWRWRMQGDAAAAGAHREWWSRTVGAVAHAPDDARAAATGVAASAEGAPLATLVAALGPPFAARADRATAPRLPAWFLPALVVVLLGEWASRRIRGER